MSVVEISEAYGCTETDNCGAPSHSFPDKDVVSNSTLTCAEADRPTTNSTPDVFKASIESFRVQPLSG
jgi:hypothetical protein